jgi:uncharacterized protein
MQNEASIHPIEETSPAEQEQSVQHGPKWVFFGGDGLRTGWSAVLFVAIFFLLNQLADVVEAVLRLPTLYPGVPASPAAALVFELANVGAVILATWIMALIEGRAIRTYGYSGRARLIRFLCGCVWGFVALSAMVGALWKAHFLAFDATLIHGANAWMYGFAWLSIFILTGIFEESLLRGYLQYTLTRGIGFWWGALLMSILFGAIHVPNSGESPVGLFSAGAVGLVFCISLWYTGSLWWAIGFHATWDWAQTFFYGTPDSGMIARGSFMSEHPTGPLLWSGGPTGPEGSLYIIPVLLIMALAMWLWWRGRGVTTAYRQDV